MDGQWMDAIGLTMVKVIAKRCKHRAYNNQTLLEVFFTSLANLVIVKLHYTISELCRSCRGIADSRNVGAIWFVFHVLQLLPIQFTQQMSHAKKQILYFV